MSKPTIRIKGFSGDWSEEKANAIFHAVSDKGHPELPVLSATQDRGMIIRDDAEKLVIHDKRNEVGYKRVVPGQFVIHLRSFQGGFAHSDVEGITSPAYTVMEFKEPERHNDYFWKYVFSSKAFVNRLRVVTYGIRDGRSISYEDFLGLPFLFPSVEEQGKIASFIKLLGEQITNLSDKITSLKTLKICYLSRLFPIGGGYEPSIRLSGFSGEWVEKTLGECFDERNERSSKGELLSVTIADGIKLFSELNRHDSSSADKSNYKVVHKGDIVYNSMRMWQGASGCSDYDGIVSPAYTVLIPKEGIDPHFFAFYFKNSEIIHKFRINSQGLTSDTWNLKYPAFSKIKIRYPKDIDEQRQIASFFTEMNKMISLHSEELDKVKSLKASYLESMFV